MSKFDSNNFGTGWGMPQNDLNQGQGYSMPSYINGMDFASDSYQNSGVPNVGGLSYGQSMKGTPSSLAGGERSFMDSMLGGKNTDGSLFNGWGGAAVGAAGAIFNAYAAMKNYGLANEQFKFNKDMTTRNFNAQANMTNSTMADRQGGRVSARGGQDVASYMGQYGVQKI